MNDVSIKFKFKLSNYKKEGVKEDREAPVHDQSESPAELAVSEPTADFKCSQEIRIGLVVLLPARRQSTTTTKRIQSVFPSSALETGSDLRDWLSAVESPSKQLGGVL
jgi:hypothetical protein